MKIKNSYFNYVSMIILLSTLYLVIFIGCRFILSKLGVDFKEYSVDLYLLFLIMIIFIMLYCGIDNRIFEYLRKDFIKSKSIYVIILPIIIAILKNILSYISRCIPLFWGGKIIGVGANQVISNLKACTIEYWICICVFPAFNEEILFRFLLYSGLLVLINQISSDIRIIENNKFKDNYINKMVYIINNIIGGFICKLKNDLFIEKKNYAVVGWVIITSTLFSLAHGSDITNFYIYFIPGALYAMLYLKYGLLSSMLCHMFGNYFSPIIHYFWIIILKYFLILQ